MYIFIRKVIKFLKYRRIRIIGYVYKIIYKNNISHNVVFFGIPKVIDIENLIIKDDVRINENVFIHAAGGVIIEENSTLSYGCTIISTGYDTNNWDSYLKRKHVSKKIIIGKNVWIGANVVILPGVKICDNTIIAAGTVVNKNIENEYCIYGGVPVVKIKDIR